MKNKLFELSKLSGEDSVKARPSYVLPMVRLNGKKGVFVKTIIKEDGTKEKIELGDKIEGVMLKVRRVLNEFSKDYRIYSNEHNSWKDPIILFEVKKTAKGFSRQMIDSGTIDGLREKYPLLKMTQVVYFLIGNEVVKLLVKGKGLANLFEFWAKFKSDEHIFQYSVEIGCIEESNDLGEFYSTTFERKSEIDDLTLVEEKMLEVVENLTRIENYYAEQTIKQELTGEETTLKEEEIPIEEYDKIPEPPKYEDIPIIEDPEETA